MSIETPNSHIGKILQFDEHKHLQALAGWDRVLKPANEAIVYFETLNIGKPENIPLRDWFTANTANIEKLYRTSIETMLKTLKISIKAMRDAYYNNIENDVASMKKMLDKVQQTLKLETTDLSNQYNYGEGVSLLKLRNGKFYLDEEGKATIKKNFEITIETENQSNVYQLFLDANEALAKLKQASWIPLKVESFQLAFLGNGLALFQIDEKGLLIFPKMNLENYR